ncbi:MAG: cell division protein ZapE [Gemmatimonadota bacterium]
MKGPHLDLGSALESLDARADPARLLRGFRPPERFAEKRFKTYEPRHATQRRAADRLARIAEDLGRSARLGGLRRLLSSRRPSIASGIYLDGGFGVGKTHLLASLWNASPEPRAYLSFDELMYFIGLTGPEGAAGSFAGYRLLAVDEWELDDPGNLKMALAFLRAVLQERVFVAVTSNTLPLELGAGRFSQKDFRAEVEELASAFEVLRVEGDDYRHRHFESTPGTEYFLSPAAMDVIAAEPAAGTLRTSFPELLAGLETVHPIRYRDLATAARFWLIDGVAPLPDLRAALRWVHFIGSLYDAGLRMAASCTVPLGEMFPEGALTGPFGKKLSRCLSRMEELLGENDGGGMVRDD